MTSRLCQIAVAFAVACHSHGRPNPKQTEQPLENHLAFSLLKHACIIILRLVRLHKQSRDEEHTRAPGSQQKAKGKSRARCDAADWMPERFKLAFNRSMQTLAQLLGIPALDALTITFVVRVVDCHASVMSMSKDGYAFLARPKPKKQASLSCDARLVNCAVWLSATTLSVHCQMKGALSS